MGKRGTVERGREGRVERFFKDFRSGAFERSLSLPLAAVEVEASLVSGWVDESRMGGRERERAKG